MNKNLRNIGVIAHVDAGKTTLTERILYYTGRSHRIGEVHHGNTTMDFDPEERRRGITINSAATTVYWHGTQVNIIDTPGHIDFNIEVNRSLRVLDGAVVVLDAVAGVEPQTETNWRLADRYHVPRLCFVNKLDRIGADFHRVVDLMRERLGITPLVLQLPIGKEHGFRGVVDLIEMKSLEWVTDDASQLFRAGDIAPAQLDQAKAMRAVLTEAVVEQDVEALHAYLHGESISDALLRACIRKGTINGAFVPVLAGSAFKNKGVEPLLNAVVDFLPAPSDTRRATPLASGSDGPFAALAFKVVNDDHGPMVFVRVYRGGLARGEIVLNANTGKKERIGRLYEIHADKREERHRLQAGEIMAVMGLKDTVTGHTLCDPAEVVMLEEIVVPEPVMDVALEPKTQADQQNLAKALQSLCREDPSLRYRQDHEAGQVILSGMGELQLEVSIKKLSSKFGVEVSVGRPQVAYRETITRQVEVNYEHKKQTGGPGQYAEVRLRLRPLARGAGIRFEDEIVGGAIPREFVPSVEAGIRRVAESGVVAGYACVDFAVALVDGSYHERDSSTYAFEAAGASAFREAFIKAKPVLLEPVMAVEVVTPAAYLGPCIGDLSRRRGEIRGQQHRGNAIAIDAYVPLKEMFGYIGSLRALSSGRAHYTMQLDHYAPVPAHVMTELTTK